MKKTIATIVAVLLVACLTVPAFAAPKEIEEANLPSAEIGEGKTVSSASAETSVSSNTNTDAKEALADAISGENTSENVEGKVLYLVRVGTTGSSVKIRFAMPQGKKLAYVLIYTGGKWSQIEGSYSDGILTAATSAESAPLAIVLEGSAPLSPQTGETAPAVYVVCAMVMAAAAAVFFFKSRKAA